MTAGPWSGGLRSVAGRIKRRLLKRRAAPSDESLIAGHLRTILGDDIRNPVVAIDIGGASDIQPHWHSFRDVGDFIVYEPHRESYEALLERRRTVPGYDRFRYLMEALSGTGGDRTLYKTNVPTGTSLLPPKKGGFGDYPGESYFWPVSTEVIGTATLADSLDREGIDRIDVIKLDTQGSELDILEGLDRRRCDGLLFIETEITLLDFYEGNERAFERMLRFMSDRGFVLFDLRTNRFLGSAVRMDQQELKAVLGDDLNLPPNGHRLGEVDAVFAREPRLLLEAGEPNALRRMMVLLIGYSLFPEAVYLASESGRRGIIPANEVAGILEAMRGLHAVFARRTHDAAEMVRGANGRAWAQYMWVAYPSA